jgi:hypothetical protein
MLTDVISVVLAASCHPGEPGVNEGASGTQGMRCVPNGATTSRASLSGESQRDFVLLPRVARDALSMNRPWERRRLAGEVRFSELHNTPAGRRRSQVHGPNACTKAKGLPWVVVGKRFVQRGTGCGFGRFRGATPLELRCAELPRVARAAQPWALSRNPVGIPGNGAMSGEEKRQTVENRTRLRKSANAGIARVETRSQMGDIIELWNLTSLSPKPNQNSQ